MYLIQTIQQNFGKRLEIIESWINVLHDHQCEREFFNSKHFGYIYFSWSVLF